MLLPVILFILITKTFLEIVTHLLKALNTNPNAN